jgi:hypothetical protein
MGTPSIQRPMKSGNVRTYVEEVNAAAPNDAPIIANEVDADLDTLYNVWNSATSTFPPSGPAGGDLAGSSYPAPVVAAAAITRTKIAADAWLSPVPGAGDVGKWLGVAAGPTLAYLVPPASVWVDTGTALTPTNTTRYLTLPGDATKSLVILGTQTSKARVQGANSTPLSANLSLNRDVVTGAIDDTSKPAWQLSLVGAPNDNMTVGRNPAGGAYAGLLTLDATGLLTVPGDPSTGRALQFGNLSTGKGRLTGHPAAAYTYFSHNAALNAGGAGWTQDDSSKPSWVVVLDCANDSFAVQRFAPGGAGQTLAQVNNSGALYVPGLPGGAAQLVVGVGTAALRGRVRLTGTQYQVGANKNDAGTQDDATLSSWWMNMDCTASGWLSWYRKAASGGADTLAMYLLPSGDFAISGANATKTSGTLWANPSDARMKRNVADYMTGLAAITQLRPVSFQFNGFAGSVDDGATRYGFVAQEVEPIMPDCVGEQTWTPPPQEGAPAAEPITLKSLDQSNMILALVNAVKELAARVVALEGAA